MNDVASRLSTLCAALALLASCASTPAPKTSLPARVAWTLRPPGAWPADFLWRQEVEASWRQGKKQRHHISEVVLQKRRDELTLIALTHLGIKAFVLRQRGLKVSAESHAAGALPFPPRYILDDIQRTWMPLGPTPPPGFTGTRQWSLEREKLIERWVKDRLVERRFISPEAPGKAIVIRYSRGKGPGDATLTNERLGYSLRITTLSARDL